MSACRLFYRRQIEATQAEWRRCRGLLLRYVDGERLLHRGRETPDVSVPEIDDDLAQDLPASIRRTQHCHTGLDVNRIAGALGLHNRWSRIPKRLCQISDQDQKS